MKDVTKCKSMAEGDPVNTNEVTRGSIVTDASPSPEGEGQAGLLSAFRLGLEQSLSLVQQMSPEERAIAYNTLASLCGANSLIGKLFQEETPSGGSDLKPEEAQHTALDEEDIDPVSVPVGNSSEPNEAAASLAEEKTKKMVMSRAKSQRLIAKAALSSDKPKTLRKRPRRQAVKAGKTKSRSFVNEKKTSGSSYKNANNHNSDEPTSADDESDGGCQSANAQTNISEEQIESTTSLDDDGKHFQCGTCKKKLKSSFSLQVHMRTHTGEKPYPCHLCDKSFSCSTNCKRHVRETHMGARPYNCTRCSMGYFRQINLEMHLEEDHRLTAQELKDELTKKVTKPEFQLFTCKDCGKAFKTKSNLKVHESVHKDEREHACPHCEKKFSFRNNLKRHLMIHTGARPHNCSTCSMGFIEAKSLKLHIRREHGGVDDSVEPEKVTCEICGRLLSSKTSLQNHLLTHTGSKPHVCSQCSKAFSMKSNLKRHMRSHSNDKPWECPTCSKRFTEKKSMEVHFRIHTGEKPYTCKECGKTFAQASTLQGHMPVHSKERAVSCEICGKSFLRMSHYRFHVAKHNSPPKHSCTECPRAFYRKADLERHRQTHTGERPYQCSICPKQFSRPLYLKDHLNLHLGQRPYACDHCPVTYAESSARNKHMRRCPMRVTSKPPPLPLPLPLVDEPCPEESIHDDSIVAQLDIVTTAMTTAALSSLTMTPGGELVAEPPTAAAAAVDKLVALANTGMLTLQSGDAPDMAEAGPGEVEVLPSWEQLGLQTIDVSSVKEVHVQDVDTEVGKTKHYIVVLQAASQ